MYAVFLIFPCLVQSLVQSCHCVVIVIQQRPSTFSPSLFSCLNATCTCFAGWLKIHSPLHVLVRSSFVLPGFQCFVYRFATACCHAPDQKRLREEGRPVMEWSPSRYPWCWSSHKSDQREPQIWPYPPSPKQEMTGHAVGPVYGRHFKKWTCTLLSVHLYLSFSTDNCDKRKCHENKTKWPQ